MKRNRHGARVSQDRWLVSYADFITLLFGFFVVLYAFARADQKKQQQIPGAINSAFHAMGIFPGLAKDTGSAQVGASTTGIVTGEQVRLPAEVKQDLERIQRELSQSLSGEMAARTVSITMSRKGLVISLHEAGFFGSGSAVPKPEAMKTLRQIAVSLGEAPFDLCVEGHTDNVPIHNAAFDSNWELSAARATNIARLFLEWHSLPPERLSAAGYGEFHPVAGNDTAEGRAKNRRVDLVVVPRTNIDFSAPTQPGDKGPWRRITDDDETADPSAGEMSEGDNRAPIQHP
jgi:chemotaxis protein MotB